MMQKIPLKLKVDHLRELNNALENWFLLKEIPNTREGRLVISLVKPVFDKVRKKVIDKEGSCANKTFKLGLAYYEAWALNQLLIEAIADYPPTTYTRNCIATIHRQIDQKL